MVRNESFEIGIKRLLSSLIRCCYINLRNKQSDSYNINEEVKMKSLTLLISLLLMPSISLAVDSSGNYAVWGVGKKSCFGFNKAIVEDGNMKYKYFIQGFLTAYNIFTEKTYSITGKMKEDEVIEWLSEYCKDNPMSGLENALVSLTFDNYDKRMKSSGTGVGR
jgi:hypothetical protein